MTQTIQATDQFLASEELRHFVLFLENHDGIGWNTLRADLSSIWLSCTCDADYLSKATFRTAQYVEQWRATYWAKYAINKSGFYHYQNSFVAAAAAQIAFGEIEDFKLGNYSL